MADVFDNAFEESTKWQRKRAGASFLLHLTTRSGRTVSLRCEPVGLDEDNGLHSHMYDIYTTVKDAAASADQQAAAEAKQQQQPQPEAKPTIIRTWRPAQSPVALTSDQYANLVTRAFLVPVDGNPEDKMVADAIGNLFSYIDLTYGIYKALLTAAASD